MEEKKTSEEFSWKIKKHKRRLINLHCRVSGCNTIMLTKLKKRKCSELIGILGEVISLGDGENLFLSILQFLNLHITQVGRYTL